ncbi:MAG: Hsp70 family protein [Planctomycetota bacterium]
MDAKTQEKPSDTTVEPIVGIDLGTTNSLVAHCTEAGPVILESPEGERSLPSVVRLLAAAGGGYEVAALGRDARAHAREFPTTTLHSVKRLMGRGVADLGDDLAYLPYAVVEGPHATARVALPPREHPLGDPGAPEPEADPSATVTPQEISAIILRELKRWADAALGRDVIKAVVTVPAYFDDAQRQATRDAGRLAGFNVLRIVNEPTAAALAYGLGVANQAPTEKPASVTRGPGGTISLNTKINPEACAADAEVTVPQDPTPHSQTVAIYDLGGGTFDISVLRLQSTETGGTIDQVLATDGDTHLGGDDFDQALISLFQTEIRHRHPDIDFPPATQQAFRTLVEQTKIKLSADDEAQIEIDLGEVVAGQTYIRTVTREEFERLVSPLVDRTLDACRRVLRNAGVDVSGAGVDRVILVGGSTRVPLVRAKVAELFDTEPYTALNPDEVVALGASVQAAVLAGIHRDTLLLDVIPLSLGIETMGGAVAKLIVANSTIPARASDRFSTFADGQTKVKIHVLQGERELVKDCRSLATFDLTGIPPMPAGLPKIDVTFLVDANGILSVQATEERSGRRAQVQVVPNHGLTRDEIDRIEQDSFTHARADMTAHRLIDLRLNARLDLRNIRRQLDRFGSDPEHSEGPDALALDPAYRAEIEAHMQKVQTFIDTPDPENDADAFQQALHDLDHATLRLAELNIARTLREDQRA